MVRIKTINSSGILYTEYGVGYGPYFGPLLTVIIVYYGERIGP